MRKLTYSLLFTLAFAPAFAAFAQDAALIQAARKEGIGALVYLVGAALGDRNFPLPSR